MLLELIGFMVSNGRMIVNDDLVICGRCHGLF
jgi:hypothetical protein